MNPAILAVALSASSAIGYALGAVVQVRVAARPRRRCAPATPLWWLSVLLNGAGAALHVAALRYGSLDVVQPLGALTLVFALPFGALLAGRRVTAGEWRGAATTLGGLGLLLLVVDTSAPGAALDAGAVSALGMLATIIVAVLLYGGDAGAWRGPRLAAAGGVAFAVASVLSQAVMLRLSEPASGHLVTIAIGTAAAGLSVAGMMLAQSAYRFGLGAPLATVTLVNPVFSAAVGVLLLGRSISAVEAVVAVPAALLAACGVVLLARRPGRTEPDPQATVPVVAPWAYASGTRPQS